MSIILFIIFGSITRKSESHGVLMPSSGLIRVLTPQAGIIIERRVQEGQSVIAGQILFVLSSEVASDGITGVQTKILELIQNRKKSFQSDIEKINNQYKNKIDISNKKILSLSTEVEKRSEQVVIQKNRLRIAENEFSRFNKLLAEKFISSAQLEGKQIDVLDQRQKLSDIENSIRSLTRELDNSKAELKNIKFEAERENSSVDQNINILEQEIAQSQSKKQIVVFAPSSGVVSSLMGETGQYINVGASLC